MKLIEVFVIAIALGMDAFGVSLGIGINKSKNLEKQQNIHYLCIFTFGFFQFLLSLIGGVIGSYINNNIVVLPDKLVALVIGIVGILMIYDGTKKNKSYNILKRGMILVLGISVSIDAFTVGFTTFSVINSILIIFLYSLIIGFITSVMCAVAFIFSKFVARINLIAKYSNYIGGFILLLISIKIALNI